MGLRRTKLEIKTPEQIRLMRAAGLVVQRALAEVSAHAAPGVSTKELDAVAADVIARHGAIPSFLNYGRPPFPAVTCISVNSEIVHGIPGSRVLADGDLVSVDCGAILEGWHGDSAVTISVGDVSAKAQQLSSVTRAALWDGIAAARPGGRVGDIEHAIESSIDVHEHPYGIIEGYSGHGIGTKLHMEPDVLNYGKPNRGPRLVPGLALAIEPMVTWGSPDTKTLADDWTVATVDDSLAAHWEHTIAITEGGVWVLTCEDGGEFELAARGVPFAPLGD